METVVKDLKTSYFEKGEGEYVFILHGWGTKKEVHSNMADIISQKYKVVALDLAGFGESDEPKEPWKIDDYVDFVIDFIEKFSPKKVILLGHSNGGRIIIKLANRTDLPFEIDKIVLMGSAGIKPKRTMKYYFKVYSYKTIKFLLTNPPLKYIFPKAIESYKNKVGSADYRSASDIMKRTLTLCVNEDLTPILKNIKQETLLVWGENDTATPLSDGKIMEREIKNSGLVTLKNAGHYSFIDQQFTFNKVIMSFLKIGE